MHLPRALLVVLCLGCGGSGRPVRIGPAAAHPTETPSPDASVGVTEAPSGARIRIIHAAVESRDTAVSIVADGASTALAGPTGFQFASPYATLEVGTHSLSAQGDGRELIAASIDLDGGFHTVVAYSTADFPVALATVPDASAEAAPDTASVRFFHGIVGSPAIDACLAPDGARGDGHPLFTNVPLGAFGESTGAYAQVAAGTAVTFQLRAHDATPCHGRPIGVASFTPASGNNYTLIGVGRTRGRRVAPELVFCADPPATDTSCATLALASR